MYNRKSILLLCAFLLSYGEARCQDADEREMLAGTWKFVSARGGSNQDKETRVRGGMAFKDDIVSFVGERGKVATQGVFTVDGSTNPKSMDITLEKNGAKVVTRMIYEVDGDTLKICHFLGTKASQERPKEFMSSEQCVLGTLKRENK